MDDVWTQRSELLGRSFGVQSLRSWWPGRMPADRVGSEPDSGGAAVALARLDYTQPVRKCLPLFKNKFLCRRLSGGYGAPCRAMRRVCIALYRLRAFGSFSTC